MARTPSSERARRLIAIMGRLAPNTRIRIADLAAAVGSTEAELTADLETLSMCGVAPYYPDDLAPLVIEDGYVEVWGELPALKGPVRLSAAEAGALVAALQAAGFNASDELPARLLAAAGSAGFDAEDLERTVRAAIPTHDAGIYETIACALQEHAVVRIEYASQRAEGVTARDIEPVSLFAERGAWYLTAWCRWAGDWRTFRVDRIRAAELMGERFNPAERGVAPGAVDAFPTQGLPSARLHFSAGEEFTDREWPGARVLERTEDGGVTVEVPYGGTEWIARHVVARLGAVEVLEPAAVRSAVHELATDLRGV